MQRQRKVKDACKMLTLILAYLFLAGALWGQCEADLQGVQPVSSQIQQLFEQKNWAEVVRLAGPVSVRSADIEFDYGLALARMQNWTEARSALLAGERSCPHQKRFDVELAGIAFQLKRYPESAAWLRRGLKLDPADEYANNFAGTVYLLMGNINAALKYWNRIQKPYVASVEFDPQLRLERLILDRAFVFSPASVISEAEFETTEMRLKGLGIFPRFNLVLSPHPIGDSGGNVNEKFDIQFHARELDGFGSGRLPALVSTFAGAVYETIYPSYFDIGKTAANFQSLLRWDSQKLRAWFSISAPLHGLPQRRWQLQANFRDENWAIRRSFSGVAPVLGSLKLERESLEGSVAGFQSGRLQWTTGAELSHRSFRNVVEGTALTPALVVPGYELKYQASVDYKVLDIPERRFWMTMGAGSELARIWPAQPQVPGAPSQFARLQGSALAHWFPEQGRDKYEMQARLRVGQTFGSAPFDELFLLGVERDTDLWLRGHIGTRDREKGSSPLGRNYILENADFSRLIYNNGLFGIMAGPLLDVARAGAPASGLSTGLATGQWLFDVGAAMKVTVLGTSFVLTYGRDLRAGSNAFYGTIAR